MAQKLKPAERKAALAELDGWSAVENRDAIAKTFSFKDFNAEMARRMNEDLVFDTSDAVRDFGFAPRKFEPEPLRPDSA